MAYRIRHTDGDEGKRRMRVELICFAIIIVVATAVSLSDGETDVLSWDETALTLSISQQLCCTVPYGQITQVALLNRPDFGECLSGEDTPRLRSGTWQSDELGRYAVYAYREVPVVICISTADGCYLFNLDQEETTEEFYSAFLEMLDDGGYAFRRA